MTLLSIKPVILDLFTGSHLLWLVILLVLFLLNPESRAGLIQFLERNIRESYDSVKEQKNRQSVPGLKPGINLSLQLLFFFTLLCLWVYFSGSSSYPVFTGTGLTLLH